MMALVVLTLAALVSSCSATATLTVAPDAAAGLIDTDEFEQHVGRGARTPALPASDEPPGAQAHSSEGEITADNIALAAANMSTASHSYRFEVFLSVDAAQSVGDPDIPFVTGETAGNVHSFTLHVGDSLVDLDANTFGDRGVDPTKMVLQYITDDTSVYLHGPLFGELAKFDPGVFDAIPIAETVSAGWGRYDVSLLDGTTVGQRSLATPSTPSAEETLAVLRRSDNARDAGASTVRGHPTQMLLVDVPADEVAKMLSQYEAVTLPASAYADINAPPLEIHIGADGHLRRMEWRIDLNEVLATEHQSASTDLTFWMRLDLFDFGQPIEIAAPEDAVDVTAEIQELIELGN